MSIWKGERVVKGLMGYREWDPAKDENYTHVIMTEQAFDEAVKHTEATEWLLEDAKKKFRHLSNTEYKNNQLLKEYNELQDQFDQCKKELADAKARVKREQEKNSNLQRIARERANAARGLHPKKDRLGYIILSAAEQTYRYKVNNKLREEVFWKVVVQTPWAIGLDRDVVMATIKTEIEEVFVPLGFGGYYATLPPKWEEVQYGFFFDLRFKANCVKGYWEVEFWSTIPIEFPSDMMP